MSKTKLQFPQSSSSYKDHRPFFIAALISVLLVCFLWSFTDPWPNFSTFFSNTIPNDHCRPRSESFKRNHDSQEKTFYDDPELSYTIEKPIKDWDEKRREWLHHHPSFLRGLENRIFLLTGSQPTPCKSPFGDHLLLRCFKNKVDYCRIHGHDIYYSNAFLNPEMRSFWTKIPLIRSAMVAHPEAEWIWWMDSDAIFTDMDFKVPLEKYKRYNLVVHGWSNLIYDKQSWVAVNAGIFLIRNCQWSMEFLGVWASMGPQSPNYKRWGQILRSTFKDKMFPESDDQSALIYLVLKDKNKWGEKSYIENEYSLHGYWIGIVGKLENITRKYAEVEKRVEVLRRRRAEVVSESYGRRWKRYSGDVGDEKRGWRRPFITHFTGCQPCSGEHNPSYEGNSCWVGMERALNFADNQVLRNFGFVHRDLENSSSVLPWHFGL